MVQANCYMYFSQNYALLFTIHGLLLTCSLTVSILSRLALPICLNYLYIIQAVRVDNNTAFDTEIPQTAFALVSHTITTTTPL